MANVLRLRRGKDGSLHYLGEPPEDLYMSAGLITRSIELGEMTVDITLHTENKALVYRLRGLNEQDGTPNATSWHVTLLGETDNG